MFKLYYFYIIMMGRKIKEVYMSKYLHEDLTEKVISCFYQVYNTLGYGFLEKVYENSLKIELEKYDLKVLTQYPINVYYEGQQVGEYYADMLVEDKLIIELKTCETLHVEHELQLVNYLRATDIELGLLLNFGREPKVRRKIFSNLNEKILTTHIEQIYKGQNQR